MLSKSHHVLTILWPTGPRTPSTLPGQRAHRRRSEGASARRAPGKPLTLSIQGFITITCTLQCLLNPLQCGRTFCGRAHGKRL